MIKSPFNRNKKFNKFNKFETSYLIKIYTNLFLNRVTEEIIQKNYSKGYMKTPTHLGIGQEAVSTGVCMNLKKNDYVFSHHRSHLPYIALGGNLYSLFCELMGKKNGVSGGKGGSVHLNINKKIKYASVAILGEPLGLAVGSGLAFKYKKKKNISCVFFGNATLEEGISYETLSFASLKKIPTLFVYENNFYSTEMSYDKRLNNCVDYKKLLESLNIPYLRVDGNNISETYTVSKKIIKYIRDNSKPFFIEFITYRWLEHCGPYYDYNMRRNYRSKKEIEHWKEACPIKNFRKFIIKKYEKKYIEILEKKIINKVTENFQKALNSDPPNKDSIYTNV